MDILSKSARSKMSLRWGLPLLASSLIMGCATNSQPTVAKRSILEPVGENAGKVVIFSPAVKNSQSIYKDHKQNVVSLFINDHFLAALSKNHVVTQGLCAGDYKLVARSTNDKLATDNKVIRHSTSTTISVQKNQTSYFELVRKNEKWAIQKIDEKQPEKYKTFFAEDKQFVRRLPESMMQCGLQKK